MIPRQHARPGDPPHPRSAITRAENGSRVRPPSVPPHPRAAITRPEKRFRRTPARRSAPPASRESRAETRIRCAPARRRAARDPRIARRDRIRRTPARRSAPPATRESRAKHRTPPCRTVRAFSFHGLPTRDHGVVPPGIRALSTVRPRAERYARRTTAIALRCRIMAPCRRWNIRRGWDAPVPSGTRMSGHGVPSRDPRAGSAPRTERPRVDGACAASIRQPRRWPNTPCSRPRWRGRELGASRGRKLRRSSSIPSRGVIVAIYTIIPPPDGEHPQFAGAASSRRESRFRRLPAGRLTGSVRLLFTVAESRRPLTLIFFHCSE
jgi:hypothetical protein